MRRIYITDLSDAEWACLKNHLPASKLPGKMCTHVLREIVYAHKSGCFWCLLPGDFPPWQTVYYHFRKFRLSGLWFLVLKALRAAERKRNVKDPNPSAAIVDSQSIKSTEESAGRDGHEAHRKGYDVHKHLKARKRHLLVNTLGLPLWVYVTPADVQDRVGVRCSLAGLKPLVPRLKKL
jgi:putative transposase